jgi:hypothetical protein
LASLELPLPCRELAEQAGFPHARLAANEDQAAGTRPGLGSPAVQVAKCRCPFE